MGAFAAKSSGVDGVLKLGLSDPDAWTLMDITNISGQCCPGTSSSVSGTLLGSLSNTCDKRDCLKALTSQFNDSTGHSLCLLSC